MLKAIWGIVRRIFGPSHAFLRVDYPGFADRELPKRFIDVDRTSAATRARLQANREIRQQARRR